MVAYGPYTTCAAAAAAGSPPDPAPATAGAVEPAMPAAATTPNNTLRILTPPEPGGWVGNRGWHGRGPPGGANRPRRPRARMSPRFLDRHRKARPPSQRPPAAARLRRP